MSRYLVEVPVIRRVFALVEADSKQEALQTAREGQFNEEDIVGTVVDTDDFGIVVHGVFDNTSRKVN